MSDRPARISKPPTCKVLSDRGAPRPDLDSGLPRLRGLSRGRKPGMRGRRPRHPTRVKGFLGGPTWIPLCFPTSTPARASGGWTGGGKAGARVHRGHGLPHFRGSTCLLPPAFGVPKRVPGGLFVAGRPVLWDGDHAIHPASVSGVSRLRNHPTRSHKGKGSPARAAPQPGQGERGPKASPPGVSTSAGDGGPGLGDLSHLFCAVLLGSEVLVLKLKWLQEL